MLLIHSMFLVLGPLPIQAHAYSFNSREMQVQHQWLMVTCIGLPTELCIRSGIPHMRAWHKWWYLALVSWSMRILSTASTLSQSSRKSLMNSNFMQERRSKITLYLSKCHAYNITRATYSFLSNKSLVHTPTVKSESNHTTYRMLGIVCEILIIATVSTQKLQCIK